MEMLNIKIGNGKPVFSWCKDIEDTAMKQIEVISTLPFVEHFSVMADCHMGMLCPIGGVIAANNIVVPSWVGVDIGCGVIAVKTNLTKSNIESVELRKKLHHSVHRGIPMGFSHNNIVQINILRNKLQSQVDDLISKSGIDNSLKVLSDVETALWEQLGTLGGGNHFCEVDYDESNRIWIVIHSGSRNIGKKIGDYFNKLAEEQNTNWHSIDTKKTPFLPVNTVEGKAYLAWMDFALRFAYLNRMVMMDEIIRSIRQEFLIVELEPTINIHHNYASLESHFGKNVWVHRKGATSAKQNEMGIIPGSMGTATYITKGLGNEQSLLSCSHGAGRKMGRKAFNIEANKPEMINDISKSMEGIVHTNFGKETNRKGKETGMLDFSEAPQAYKDIEDVMANQVDLVEPIHKLIPLINWKDAGDNS